MSATFNWTVEQMSCYPEYMGETDVVFQVVWRCNGVQSNNGVDYYGTYPSVTSVTLEAGTPFTPYANLTQQQVLGWVWATPEGNQAMVEASVQEQINNAINPPVVTPPLPWAPTA